MVYYDLIYGTGPCTRLTENCATPKPIETIRLRTAGRVQPLQARRGDQEPALAAAAEAAQAEDALRPRREELGGHRARLPLCPERTAMITMWICIVIRIVIVIMTATVELWRDSVTSELDKFVFGAGIW